MSLTLKIEVQMPGRKIVYMVGDAHISRQIVHTHSPEASHRFSEDRMANERSYLAGVYHTETLLHACQLAEMVAELARGTNAVDDIEVPYWIDGPLLRAQREYPLLSPSFPTNSYSCKSFNVDLNNKPRERVYMVEDLGVTRVHKPMTEELRCRPSAWDVRSGDDLQLLSEATVPDGSELSAIYLQINFYGFLSTDDHRNSIKKILDQNTNCLLLIRIHDRSGGKNVRETRGSTDLYKKVASQLEKLLSDDSTRTRTVVEIAADDLRQEGMFISQNVSWARTTDTLVQGIRKITTSPNDKNLESLKYLQHVRNLVVTFGPDGAICYFRDRAGNYPDANERLQLILQPDAVEHELYDHLQGRIQGVDSLICSAILHYWSKNRDISSDARIRQSWERDVAFGTLLGLKAARTVQFHAYDECKSASGKVGTDLTAETFCKTLLTFSGDSAPQELEAILGNTQLGQVFAGESFSVDSTLTARRKAALDPQVLWHFASPPPSSTDQRYFLPDRLWLYPFDLAAEIITCAKPQCNLMINSEAKSDGTTRAQEEFKFAGWLEVHYLHDLMFWRMNDQQRWSYMESTALRFRGSDAASEAINAVVSPTCPDGDRKRNIPIVVNEFMKSLAVKLLIEGPKWSFDKDQWKDREKFMGNSSTPRERGLGEECYFQVNPCARVGGPKPKDGDYYVLDRKEAENFRVLRDIVKQNFPQSGPRKSGPVNIGVFGPPGAGKSYSIKQLLSLFRTGGREFKVLTFNLSQFSSMDQVADALDQVQDVYLDKKLPAVFWDEYDTAVGDMPLYWLSRFIGPMWDGEYLQRGRSRKLPACLFVFAGSVFHTFAEFATLDYLEFASAARASFSEDDEEKLKAFLGATKLQDFEVAGLTMEDWKRAKGKDFKSRLVAKLDVMSPNEEPPRQALEKFGSQQVERGAHYLRRAAILRGCLHRDYKHLGIFNQQRLHMDEKMARAFIEIDRYYHGARSIELILKSMNITYASFINDSCLPPDVELNNHVDGKKFAEMSGGGFVPS